MVIRKHSNKNEYLLTESLWVRNFTKDAVPLIDINRLNSMEDYRLFHENELENFKKRYTKIDSENISRKKIVIISDGFKFDERHLAVDNLPKDITIIATNGALRKWKSKKPVSFYVVNNPFEECTNFLPDVKNVPRCIASTRTNPRFLTAYKGIIHVYSPVSDDKYAGPKFNPQFRIDDYRSPICAAIGLAYRFGVERLLLLCCDDSFEEYRPASVGLNNGLFCYPQHILSQKVIDANLYWLSQTGAEISNYSSGIDLVNAKYIQEGEVENFFEGNK
jgi:hypothetical protein